MSKLFVCLVDYLADISEVESVRVEHREYLGEFYKKGVLLVSGPRNPLNGGLIIGKFENMNEAREFSKNDPFVKKNIAEYRIFEFETVMFDNCLRNFL
ncbi:MAG: YciI family protein [Helicobacteraceae bacterium]|nr:YciI family protein [Helicobacteraceae bacterium]